MEQEPANVNSEKIRESILKLEEVESIGDLHVWTLSGGKNMMTCHIKIVKGFEH